MMFFVGTPVRSEQPNSLAPSLPVFLHSQEGDNEGWMMKHKGQLTGSNSGRFFTGSAFFNLLFMEDLASKHKDIWELLLQHQKSHVVPYCRLCGETACSLLYPWLKHEISGVRVGMVKRGRVESLEEWLVNKNSVLISCPLLCFLSVSPYLDLSPRKSVYYISES